MTQTYKPEEAIESVKYAYFVVYIACQMISIVLLTKYDYSPLLMVYAVALMSTRYVMAKLTSKYNQQPNVGFHPTLMKYVALANLVVTGMMFTVTKFTMPMSDVIGIFIFLTLFSNIAVLLEFWYSFIRKKAGKKQ